MLLKRIIITLVFITTYFIGISQQLPNKALINSTTTLGGQKGIGINNGGTIISDTIYVDTTAANLRPIAYYNQAVIITSSGGYKAWFRTLAPPVWNTFGSGGGGTTDSTIFATIANARRIADSAANAHKDSVLSGGTISSIPTVGYVAPSNVNSAKWISDVFYQSQVPTSSLSDSATNQSTVNLLFKSAGTISKTLNWVAGRQAATTNLISVVVNGISQTFSNPAPSSSTNGKQTVTLTNNTNTTYSEVVTTSDSKTSTSYTTYNWYNTYFIGYSTTSSPTDTELQNGINNVFPSTSYSTSGTLANPSSSGYIFFAYRAAFSGTPTFTINAATVSYNLTTRSVTNAPSSGYSESYKIWVSPFPTAAGVTYIVN